MTRTNVSLHSLLIIIGLWSPGGAEHFIFLPNSWLFNKKTLLVRMLSGIRDNDQLKWLKQSQNKQTKKQGTMGRLWGCLTESKEKVNDQVIRRPTRQQREHQGATQFRNLNVPRVFPMAFTSASLCVFSFSRMLFFTVGENDRQWFQDFTCNTYDYRRETALISSVSRSVIPVNGLNGQA